MSEADSPTDRRLHLYHRLVGLAVLAAVAAIAVPLILDFSGDDGPSLGGAVIPEKPAGLRVEEISLAPPAAPAATMPTTGDRPASQAPAAAAAAPAAGNGSGAAPQAWAVKVGSFSKENALALRDQLRSKGFTAFTEQTTADGKPLLRLYVGPDIQKSRSEQLRDRLAREFNLNDAVVVGYN